MTAGFVPPPDDEDAPVDPRRYLAAIVRYKWVVLVATMLGGAAGYLVSRTMAPVYQAQATIWVEIGTGPRGPIQEGQLLQNTNWVDLLRSYTVLDSVVKEQRLFLMPRSPEDTLALRTFDVKDRFQPGQYELKVEGQHFTLTLSGAGVIQEGNVGDSVGPTRGLAWVPPTAAMRNGADIGFSLMSPRQAALAVTSSLTASLPPQNGNFIRLTYLSYAPVQTAAVLNSIATQFVHVAAELKRDKLRELTRILDIQLQQSYADLRHAEIALETFRVNTITEPAEPNPVTPAGLQMTQTSALTNFFSMKTEADQNRRDREAIERVMTQPDTTLSAVTLEAILSVRNNAELSAALGDLTSKLANLRALRARYTEDNPTVVQAKADVRRLQHETLPTLLRQLLDEMHTRETALNERINLASRDLQEIPVRSMNEARLTRDLAISQQLYTSLEQRYSEAKLADASSIPDVRILDPAVVPDKPLSDRVPLVILGGLAGGFGVAIGLALLLDHFDRRLRYPDQVTRDMGLTILGAVPRVKSNGSSLRGEDAAQVVESLRSIRLNLVHAYGSAGPLVTTITSPGSGDGKSFLASNLALAFADAGHRTLLIDGDIRRGTLHRVLNASRKPGLIDYLSGQATKEQVVQTTRMTSVDFIGCGTRKAGGPELLASPAMSQLLIGMRAQYSVIIMDSAPLGAGVDPLLLGSLTGSLLLVLRTGVTDRELASAKLGDLNRLPIRVLGAVLNDVKPQGMYKYYSYLPGYHAEDEGEVANPGARSLPAVKT